jgi:hypothetical protein
LPVRTPVLTPLIQPTPIPVTRDLSPVLETKSAELDGWETERCRAISAPRTSAKPFLHSPVSFQRFRYRDFFTDWIVVNSYPNQFGRMKCVVVSITISIRGLIIFPPDRIQ